MTEPTQRPSVANRAINRPTDRRRWFLTIIGLAVLATAVVLHVRLNGNGEHVTLALIVLGGLLVDVRIVVDGIRALRSGTGNGGTP